MNNGHANRHGGQKDRAGHGLWAMAACCVPMIALFALIALKII